MIQLLELVKEVITKSQAEIRVAKTCYNEGKEVKTKSQAEIRVAKTWYN